MCFLLRAFRQRWSERRLFGVSCDVVFPLSSSSSFHPQVRIFVLHLCYTTESSSLLMGYGTGDYASPFPNTAFANISAHKMHKGGSGDFPQCLCTPCHHNPFPVVKKAGSHCETLAQRQVTVLYLGPHRPSARSRPTGVLP